MREEQVGQVDRCEHLAHQESTYVMASQFLNHPPASFVPEVNNTIHPSGEYSISVKVTTIDDIRVTLQQNEFFLGVITYSRILTM